jgi:hypothetical protein
LVVSVKIKPWLKEFLECKLGDPVPASKQNWVGAMIGPLVKYTPEDYKPEKYPDEQTLRIEIPRDMAPTAMRSDLGNIYVNQEGQIRFEYGVASLFKDELFHYLDDKIRYNVRHRSSNMKACIYQFCIDHHVRFDNITYENLKKMYYRQRKKREKENIKGRLMSLAGPLIFL